MWILNSTVILFGILGSYLLLQFWENILFKVGKQVLKYMTLKKLMAIFGLGMTPM